MLTPNFSKLRQELNFNGGINFETAEITKENKIGQKITPSEWAFYKGLVFQIYETGTLYIRGSLHKYWNEGRHNSNEFTKSALIDVLDELRIKFGIQAKDCVLQNLEFGVNIVPPIASKEVIRGSLLHTTKKFNDKGWYKIYEHSHYVIKIYDKAKELRGVKVIIKGELLRFEIRYVKMQDLNSIGIWTLADLIEFDYDILKNILLTQWGKILYYDYSISIESKWLLQFCNDVYWVKLLENGQRSKFYKDKRRLKQITKNHSQDIHKEISDLINIKADELSD